MKLAIQIGLIIGAFLCCVKAYTMPVYQPINANIPLMLSYISTLEARNAELEAREEADKEWYEGMERYNRNTRDWRNAISRRLKIVEAQVL